MTPSRDRDSIRRHVVPIAIVALGLLPVAMHFTANRILEVWIRQDEARRLTIQKIETALAESHLWVEEYVTGDTEASGGVHAGLKQASILLDDLLAPQGRAAAGGIVPLSDPELRGRLTSARQDFEVFRQLSRERLRGYDLGENVGVGSPVDDEYDARFRSIFDRVEAIAGELERRQASNRGTVSRLFAAILATWLAIVGLTALAVLWIERRRTVAERALQQSEQQLFQAQKMQAVGRLAGGLAHDINNYLGAIRAQSELALMRDPDNEGLKRRMDSILRSVRTASDLIERLLAFSRPRPVRAEVIDLSRLIEEEIREILRRLVGDHVHLALRLAPEACHVKIDRAHAEQIIVNLVVNARDATPDGGTVTVETSNRHVASGKSTEPAGLPPGDYVVLTVRDTGSGVDPGIRDQIFEPFFTTKERSGHSGLGLSTVYGLVSEYGGRIVLDSPPTGGTAFEVCIPRSDESPPAKTATGVSHSRLARGRERILLVEDNDELRMSTHETLETAGYRVRSVSSPEGALALADSGRPFDGVVADVALPGMNGKQLVDRLLERNAGLAVLFVSGHADEEVLRLGVSRGQFAMLRKPYRLPELTTKLREVLDA